ncbi:hypothetical protein EVAR_46006_1 [Eumeta japonica]|uniref:Uncharacterized protein n=1 Tax=Eumeta variegata TaxID=151549 RepID=A0A4C1X770_EUMVA|nr:hypothetical protein EVAR_46006_1 [Eumeta japonica]
MTDFPKSTALGYKLRAGESSAYAFLLRPVRRRQISSIELYSRFRSVTSCNIIFSQKTCTASNDSSLQVILLTRVLNERSSSSTAVRAMRYGAQAKYVSSVFKQCLPYVRGYCGIRPMALF